MQIGTVSIHMSKQVGDVAKAIIHIGVYEIHHESDEFLGPFFLFVELS